MSTTLRAIVWTLLAHASCCSAYQLAAARVVVSRRAGMTRLAVQALSDQVVVELITEPATSSGGIMLPTNFDAEETVGAFQRKKIDTGTIVSVGPGKLYEDGTVVPLMGLSVGQRVVLDAGAEGVKCDPTDSQSNVFIYPASAITAVA